MPGHVLELGPGKQRIAPPPADPPGGPCGLQVTCLPPAPPPADVIVENTQFDPDEAPLPPPPTVIGYVWTEIGKAPALQPGLGKVVL